MVKIRLKRIGAKKKPKYRIVVQDSRTRRDGAVIEEIGYFDPQANPVELRVNLEAASKWLTNGAQPTETTTSLLRKAGVEHAAVAAKTAKKA